MVQQLLAEDELKRKGSRLRPLLTPEQEVARLHWILSWLMETEEGAVIVDMNNVVHIDEEWFNEDSDKKTYYVFEGETLPHRMVHSKRFMGKIMFPAAVARPRYDYHRKAMFTGKIGIWPFAKKGLALRTSKNREKGAEIITPIDSINKDVYKEYLITHVIPAIKDNTTPHRELNDPDIVAAGSSDGWDIRLLNQPPRSPDLNVLDLGYFAFIQSLQYQKPCRTLPDLISVETSYLSKTSTTSSPLYRM
ncbi:hypothetical protein ATCC90586_009022 [Pythium insidiosum]|nr:hypothetical protein ATCC90586_009022 [Pythium insidiosum]